MIIVFDIGASGIGRDESKFERKSIILNLTELKVFVSFEQGAQGETGSKGERGDPGLPVSQFLFIP